MVWKKFDKDFKIEAVNLLVNQKRPVTALDREFGIYENTLYKYK